MPATKTDNMLSSLRLGVIERLALSFWAGTLPEDVDRIPLLMRPRGSEIMSRCCIYKDRAILRERLRAAMGFRLEDETDDSIPLRTYAEEALERKEPNWPILTVCDIACQGCMRARYYVTDACQGCVARSCIGSCRFGAISFSRGRSTIDPEKCRNCGMCMDACPYHAIVRLNVPCEAACPVGIVRNACREGQEVRVLTLESVCSADVDMLSLVIIGNSETRRMGRYMATPRGYAARRAAEKIPVQIVA